MPSSPLKLAVLGDSRATNFGCPDDVAAFPAVLAELVRGGYEVRSFARPALRLDRYLRDVDDLLDWGPDVVLSAFGGRESMYRMAGWLRHLPCDPDASLQGKGLRLPVAWVRRQVWRSVNSLFARNCIAFERLMRLIGARTYRQPEEYRTAVKSLLSLTAALPAETVLMGFFPSSMGKYPWCPSVRAQNHVVNREIVSSSSQSVRMWEPQNFVDFAGLFLSDGIHLNEAGHVAMAKALAQELRTQALPNVATAVLSQQRRELEHEPIGASRPPASSDI